jgi:hypothetical protein
VPKTPNESRTRRRSPHRALYAAPLEVSCLSVVDKCW